MFIIHSIILILNKLAEFRIMINARLPGRAGMMNDEVYKEWINYLKIIK